MSTIFWIVGLLDVANGLWLLLASADALHVGKGRFLQVDAFLHDAAEPASSRHWVRGGCVKKAAREASSRERSTAAPVRLRTRIRFSHLASVPACATTMRSTACSERILGFGRVFVLATP
jgi:hypothetical protein